MRFKNNIFAFVFFLPGFLLVGGSFAQEQITDQVGITESKGKIYAAMPAGALVAVELSAGEKIIEKGSKGIHGYARTPNRILGISTKNSRWAERRVDLFEDFLETIVTPRVILVRTDKHLYGFQGEVGQWKVETIGTHEKFRELFFGENLIIVVTDRRLLALSAFSGGFFDEDLSRDETLIEKEVNDNVAIFTTPHRKLIFRSQLGIWAELR